VVRLSQLQYEDLNPAAWLLTCWLRCRSESAGEFWRAGVACLLLRGTRTRVLPVSNAVTFYVAEPPSVRLRYLSGYLSVTL
jgi:hypothetical protein